MTDYSWLPYWLFGVVCIAFGFWLRGLFEQTQIAPDDPNAPEPLIEHYLKYDAGTLQIERGQAALEAAQVIAKLKAMQVKIDPDGDWQ